MYSISLYFSICSPFGTGLSTQGLTQCVKAPLAFNALALESVDESSTRANPDVGMGMPTEEPEQFKEALSQAL